MKKKLKSGVFLALNLLLFLVVFIVTTGSYTTTTGRVIDGGSMSTDCGGTIKINNDSYELDVPSGFWSSEEDFHNNSSGDETSITVSEFEGEVNFIKYADRRDANGWSNWNNPKFEIIYEGQNVWKVEDIEYNTPPVALQLVLNSFDQQHSGEIPSKAWKVTGVYPGFNTNDYIEEEWTHFLDNKYTFSKDGKVTVDLGTLKSDDETDFFGDKQIAYATYNVFSGADVAKLPATTDKGLLNIRELASIGGNKSFIIPISFGGGRVAEFGSSHIYASFETISLTSAFTRKNGTVGEGIIVIEPAN